MQVTWSETESDGWRVLDVAGAGRAGLAAARRWVGQQLATLSEEHRTDTVIVVGELLENAYAHAGGPAQLRIHHALEPCEVTVAVVDGGAGEPRMVVPGDHGGRGLVLVDRLSLEWGVSHHDDAKIVWARVDCNETDVA